MKPLTSFEAWCGRDQPPPKIITLKAGNLNLEFEEGDIRYVRYANEELIRRIYVAVRDVNWNMIPSKMTNLTIKTAEDRFHIQFDASHQDRSVGFHWHASIEGNPDGTIEYAMDSVAEREFRYCRIGFCVLHPIEGIAGSSYRAITPEGNVTGVLPKLVEPQRIENNYEVPLFPACSSLIIDKPSGLKIITDFEGDLFEMEDQRNWTDGSFKIYCTPLSLGYPHDAKAGQVFRQKVIIRAVIPKDSKEVESSEGKKVIQLALGEATGQPLPRIGFGMASHGKDLGTQELQLLFRLRPDHLKAELQFRDPTWSVDLERAIATTKQLDSALELAIFLADGSEEALETLKARIHKVPVARVIVFHEAEAPVGTTSSCWMQLVRKYLSSALPTTQFVGGTNGNFAELNRQRPDISVMDGVSYTINPQVHAWDERSLIEAIEAQRDTVVAARSYCGALPICISSVTLKPPFNQAAIEECVFEDPNELPAAVDQRQMSLFAAAWTIGSINSLALGGADSITYYETTGWRGLMETPDGSPPPQKFRSFPRMVFPVYWVFAFLADMKEASLLRLISDETLLLEGLAFKKDNRLGIFVANLQPHSQEVRLNSLPDGEAFLWRINEASMEVSSSNPDAFLKSSEPLAVHAGEAAHILEPYETAFLEIKLS